MVDRDRRTSGADLPLPAAQPVRSPPAAVAGEVEKHLPGRDGGRPLEARICAPPGAVRAVVLCHPHPLYGGSMHSPVPLAIAKNLAERGGGRVAWIRFNFRGVGSSEGSYGGGRGEVDDARTAIAAIRAAVQPAPSAAPARAAPVAVCGHSFGAWTAWRAAALEPDVDRVLLIAPGVRFFDFSAPAEATGFETTIFVGDRDELCSVDEARSLGVRLGASVRVFEGYDHHFLKSRRALADAALGVLAPEAPSP